MYGGISGSHAASVSLAPGAVFRDCPQCPDVVVVPAGKFVMGSTPAASTGRS